MIEVAIRALWRARHSEPINWEAVSAARLMLEAEVISERQHEAVTFLRIATDRSLTGAIIAAELAFVHEGAKNRGSGADEAVE